MGSLRKTTKNIETASLLFGTENINVSMSHVTLGNMLPYIDEFMLLKNKSDVAMSGTEKFSVGYEDFSTKLGLSRGHFQI